MIQKSKSKILKKIAYKEIILQKRRSIMVIIAIILAAFILSLCGAMFSAFYYSQKYLSHDTFETLFYNLSKEKIERLETYPDVERVALINKLIAKKDKNGVTISLEYFDDNAYYIGRNQYKLIEGTFPEKENEIVASEAYIKKYASNCKVGDNLVLLIDQKAVKFRLTGIVAFPVTTEEYYSFFITEDFLKSSSYYNPSSYTAYVHFKNADTISKEELKERSVKIAQDLDTSYDYSALFLHNKEGISIENIVLLLCIAIIVLFAGTIVIQSVLYISVNESIRSYGQMCVVGATKKQVKDIIKKESMDLILCGAPIGILLGDIIGTVLGSNQLISGFDLLSVLSLSLMVFFICFTMVMISSHKPIKLIANLSLIEAQKHIGCQNSTIKKRGSYKKLSPFWLTIISVCRDKRKVFRTMLSLVFGGVLMLISASMVASFSAEQDVQSKLFKNGGAYRLYINDTKQISNSNPLTPEMKQEIMSMAEGSKVIPIRESIGECDLNTGEVYVGGLCDIISNDGAFESRADFIEQHLIQGKMPIDKNEILLADIVQEVRPVSVGDHAILKIGSSKQEVIITGFFDATYVGTSNGMGTSDGANIMITKALAQEVFPKTENFEYSWEIVISNKVKEEMQTKIDDLISDKNLAICSFETEVSDLRSKMDLIWGGIQTISLFILLFAIVNLINMLLSNFNSRKQELSIMRSVGLTKKQLNKMFFIEGSIYVVISVGITIMIGTPISMLICKYFGEFIGMGEVSYKFPSMQILLYGAFLLILQSAFSQWFVKSINKLSISEQLHSVG